MRLPRWLVVSLLSASVLTVLGAGAWWWVTWPERTANKFCMELGRSRSHPCEASIFEPTWAELMSGRRRFFAIDPMWDAPQPPQYVLHIAERGNVKWH
jgi:hypothetical protein